MIEYLISIALFSICLLLFVMFIRVRKLYLKAKYRRARNYVNAHEPMTSLVSAQKFAEKQIKTINSLLDAEKISSVKDVLKEAVGLYLIGAVEVIGKEHGCSSESRRMMIIKVLESSLNLSAIGVSKCYAHAFTRKQHDLEGGIIRTGAEAAKKWVNNSDIPENLSLESQLAEYCAVA